MQANAKILDKSTFFMVRTKHDRRRIEAISVSGHRVLVTLHEERFYGFVDGKEMEIAYPAGTGLMYNGEQKIHQIFPGGLYHMLRSRSHAANGEKKDSEAMRGMTQLTFDFISRLRTWTLIGEEGKDFTDQSLMRLASDLCEPKRNERKLKASRHYQKASELKTKNGKRTPMPAAFTAAAGAQQLDLRRADVQSILRFITPERMKIYRLADAIHDRIDDAWRVFSPQALDQPAHVVALAAAKPTAQSVKVLKDRLRPIYRGLREIKVQPFLTTASEVAVSIATLIKRVEQASEPIDVSQQLAEIRQGLSLMRFVRELEMEVIGPLSMLLERWKQLLSGRQEEAAQRVAQLCRNLQESFEGQKTLFFPKHAENVDKHLARVIAAANDGRLAPRKRLLLVKRTLKSLSNIL